MPALPASDWSAPTDIAVRRYIPPVACSSKSWVFTTLVTPAIWTFVPLMYCTTHLKTVSFVNDHGLGRAGGAADGRGLRRAGPSGVSAAEAGPYGQF
eukprot:1190621-Prorocentrum_minimum.AAC.1